MGFDGMKALLVSVVVLLVALGCVLEPAIVFAHDHEHPELNEWYHGLHSESGAWCCDGDEATHLADIDWESKDGHYRVRVDGEWYDVPEGAVINTPNRDGRAMVWMSDGAMGKAPRCFMPGSMT
jgi:hypothetical protein